MATTDEKFTVEVTIKTSCLKTATDEVLKVFSETAEKCMFKTLQNARSILNVKETKEHGTAE